MTELERALSQLEVDWPTTPSFAYRRHARRRLAAVVFAIVLAVGIAFAVPSARSSILRFFHLGGETIERVQTLPPAQERTLRASLGIPITHEQARLLLTRPFALRDARVYRSGSAVSTLLPGGILFSEVHIAGGAVAIKKFIFGATGVRSVALDPDTTAFWFPGRHVYVPPALPARYAGSTLIWQRFGITYRLEGRGLTLDRATSLARLLR
jgi:hypothetical protein